MLIDHYTVFATKIVFIESFLSRFFFKVQLIENGTAITLAVMTTCSDT